MTPDEMQLALDPSEFAFYFQSETGIEAGDLGDFLKRTATIAKRQGAELRVVGFESGSLFVIFRAIAKSAKKYASKIGQSFEENPLDAAAKSMAVIVPITAAIVWAMTPDASAPLAKAGAEVMEKYEVREIHLITVNENIVVMDETSAEEVRHVFLERKRMRAARSNLELEDRREEQLRLADDPIHKTFEGSFAKVDGAFHFRPDGFNYYVPVDFLNRAESEKIHGDGFFYRIDAYLEFRQRMPHRMIVLKVERLYV